MFPPPLTTTDIHFHPQMDLHQFLKPTLYKKINKIKDNTRDIILLWDVCISLLHPKQGKLRQTVNSGEKSFVCELPL